jgi:hypothetical protein
MYYAPAVIGPTALLLGIIGISNGRPWALIAVLGGVLTLIVVLIPLYVWWAGRHIAGVQVSLSADDTGIHAQGGSFSSDIAWAGIRGVKVKGRTLYLQVATTAVPVPSAAFETRGARDQFLDFVQGRASGKHPDAADG